MGRFAYNVSQFRAWSKSLGLHTVFPSSELEIPRFAYSISQFRACSKSLGLHTVFPSSELALSPASHQTGLLQPQNFLLLFIFQSHSPFLLL